MDRKRKKKRGKAGKQTESGVQNPASSARKPQEAAEICDKKTARKTPDEPHRDVLAIPETGEVSLFKKKYCQVSVFTGINMSQMHLIVCLFHTGTCSNLIPGHVLNPRWLDSIF